MCLMTVFGCGETRHAQESDGEQSELHQYESDFRPSDHDQPLANFFPETPVTRVAGDTSEPLPDAESPEFVQGYRVQIFASSNIDEAKKMKETAEGLFPDEWFYTTYDAPTYKLRAGNFQARWEADRFAKLLGERGFRSAWVVPDRVLRNPPPLPSQNSHQK
jgi:hypothetical protein